MANTDYKWQKLVKEKPNIGTPSQNNIDQSFKFFVDILYFLDGIEAVIDSYNNSTYEERKAKLNELLTTVTEVGIMIGEAAANTAEPIVASLKEKAGILEPLTEPPKKLEDCLGYCLKIVDYFAGPYKKILDYIEFYGTYTVQMGLKIQAVNKKIQIIIEKILKLLAMIEEDAKNFSPTALTMSFSQIEQAKLEKSFIGSSEIIIDPNIKPKEIKTVKCF